MKLTYKLNDNKDGLVVTGGEDLEGELNIPSEQEFEGKTYPVTEIDGDAFRNCTALTSITIPNSVTKIGAWAFSFCGLTSIAISNSVTEIGRHAFCRCSGLTSIVIPDSVTRIGDNAFSYCSGLTSVVIPDSVIRIGDEAFEECTGLREIIIPKSVTTIGVGAFAGCSALTSIFVDKENRYYDSRDNCNAIIKTSTNTLILGCSTTSIPDSIVEIGERALIRCPLRSIAILGSVRWIEPSLFANTTLERITISEDNPYYCSIDNVIYTKDMTRLVMAASHGVRYGFTIPDTVVIIGERAFSGCKYLTYVVFPKSLERIEDKAFMDCNRLAEVELPDSLRSLGVEAFDSCKKLKKVKLSGALEVIPEGALSECDALESIKIPEGVRVIDKSAFGGCNSLDDVMLPESLVSIKDFTFAACKNMYEIRIPASVQEIGHYAFCDSYGPSRIYVSDPSLLEEVELPKNIEFMKLS